MQPTNIHIYPISKRDMAMYFNTNILLLAFFAITGILFSSNNNMVAGQTCQLGDLQGLITQCAVYVKKNVPKMQPSPECCSVVQKVDISCACQKITKEIEQMVDMEKVVFVARSCGKPLAPGTKCGSYTVPPS